MKALKKILKSFRDVKTSSIANYQVFSTLISKYEDLNLKTYYNGDMDKLLFANPSKAELKEKLESMV